MNRRYMLLANAIARETAYRALRRLGQQPRLSAAAMLARGEASALKANAAPAAVFALMSALLCLNILFKSSVEVIASCILVVLSLEAFLSIAVAAGFTSSFVEHGIAKLLEQYPVSPSDLLKAFIAAALLYYGGLAPLAAAAPLALILAYVGLPALAATLALSSIAVVLISAALGFYVGSKAPRKPLARIAAALSWALAFAAFYLVVVLSSAAIASSGTTKSLWWACLVPALGLAISPLRGALDAAVSAVTTLAGLAAAMWLGLRGARGAVEKSLEGLAYAGGKPVFKFRVRCFYLEEMLKDLRMASRSVRRLGAILYLAVGIPLIVAIGLLAPILMKAHPRGVPGLLMVFLACFAGAASGGCVEQLYYLEGGASRAYYQLPVTRRMVALGKALGALVLSLPGCAAIALLAVALGRLDVALGVALLAPSTALFSATAVSALVASALPEEPCAWNEMSIGGPGARVAYMLLVMLLVGVVVAVVAGLRLLGLMHPYPELCGAVTALAMAYAAARRAPDKPF